MGMTLLVKATYKIKILWGCQIVYQKAFIKKRSRKVFPVFMSGNGLIIHQHFAALWSDQVKHHAEQGSFTGSVITNQTNAFAFFNFQVRYIYNSNPVINLFKVFNFYHFICS